MTAEFNLARGLAEHRPGTAARWMLLAGLMFAFMDAGMKWIATSYSPFQVAALRSLAALPPVLTMTRRSTTPFSCNRRDKAG